MISIYPPQNCKHPKMGGVASYTHNLVNSISREGHDVIVFSERIQDTESNYIENSIMIKRCWNKGIIYPFQILYNIIFLNLDIIHIQHEYFLYGNGISAALFPILQFLLKFLNKPIIVTVHGVIPLSKLNDEFIKQNKLNGKKSILKSTLYLFTKFIVLLSDNVIVHEDKLKDILVEEYKCNNSKICVIHHGIENRTDIIENNRAKQMLSQENKKIVLFFGYLTGYKGIELLIESFDHIYNKDIMLIIAGGEHPRLRGEESYKDYINELKNMAKRKNIIFTDFIPEERIGLYFSAADVVVCPYTVFMAGSGSLALSMAYFRPFIVSEELKDMIKSDQLTFKNDARDLAKKIDMILDANSPLKSYSLKLCNVIREQRSWSIVSKKTCELYKRL